jgi:ABC-type transport system substrate-binding protein
MESAYREGFATLDELAHFYTVQGYNAGDQQLLEQLATKAKLDYEQAQQKKPPPRPAGAGQPLARADAEEMFLRHIISDQQLSAFLSELGFKEPELLLLLQTTANKRAELDAKLARQQLAQIGIKAKPATIEEAYVRGLVSVAELEAFYLQAGYSLAVIPLLLELRAQEKAEHDAAAAKKAAKAAAGGPKPTN